MNDLAVRTISALVMLIVAGAAIRLGGWALVALVTLVALGVLVEWHQLVRRFSRSWPLWDIIGSAYIGAAALSLVLLAQVNFLVWVVALVVAVDTCAYFAGRRIGGPKIAPAISPSKTWAGLAGGICGAVALCMLFASSQGLSSIDYLRAGAVGILSAVVAQAGDFFESWLKRRAGVKDSSRVIPGHGGLFDRVDGLLPVAILLALVEHRAVLPFA